MNMEAAEAALKAGNIDEALAQVKDAVKKKPADVGPRIFLFQLFSLIGDWDRALTQLNVVAQQDQQADLMARVCRPLLACEALRAEIFAGRRTPVVFGEPAPWVGLMVQALNDGAEGRFEAAAGRRAEALEHAPARGGHLNGEAFEWIADADSRLGPILEVVIEGRYVWMPLHHVARITAEAPADLRDLIWLPVTLTFVNGGVSLAFIPSRYPGSEQSPDAAIRLGRKTVWEERPGDTWLGLGQRMFASDGPELGVCDLRELVFADAGEVPAPPTP